MKNKRILQLIFSKQYSPSDVAQFVKLFSKEKYYSDIDRFTPEGLYDLFWCGINILYNKKIKKSLENKIKDIFKGNRDQIFERCNLSNVYYGVYLFDKDFIPKYIVTGKQCIDGKHYAIIDGSKLFTNNDLRKYYRSLGDESRFQGNMDSKDNLPRSESNMVSKDSNI